MIAASIEQGAIPVIGNRNSGSVVVAAGNPGGAAIGKSLGVLARGVMGAGSLFGTDRSNSMGGLVALAVLPVLLALSLATGKIVAIPAALFVPLLVIGPEMARSRFSDALAAVAGLVPLILGLVLVLGSGLSPVQPIGLNLMLLCALGLVAPCHRVAVNARMATRAGSDTRDRARRALSAVDACAPDCAALCADDNLEVIATTGAAHRLLTRSQSAPPVGSVVHMATLFDRPALLAAILQTLNTDAEANATIRLDRQEPGDAERIVDMRIRQDECGLLVIVLRDHVDRPEPRAGARLIIARDATPKPAGPLAMAA